MNSTMKRPLSSRSIGEHHHRNEPEFESLHHAKKILKELETRKKNVLGEYTQMLNLVVDAISKLTSESSDGNHRDDGTQTSTTHCESVGSTDDHTAHFSSTVGYSSESFDTSDPWDNHTRKDHTHNVPLDDDEWSASSDTLPLYMTDADALDETEFSQVMMGYAEGSCNGKVLPQVTIPIRSSRRRDGLIRPPLPPTKLKPTHRRHGSANSAPTGELDTKRHADAMSLSSGKRRTEPGRWSTTMCEV